MKKTHILIIMTIITLCLQTASISDVFADSTAEQKPVTATEKAEINPIQSVDTNQGNNDVTIIEKTLSQAPVQLAAAAPKVSLESYIAAGMADHQSTIDISGYNYTYTSVKNRDTVKQKIFTAIVDAINNNPQLFHVGTTYSVSYTIGANNTGRFTKVTPKYVMTKSQADTTRVKFNAAVQKATAGITSTMTDMEKARKVHDYLALNAEYDLVNYNKNTVPVSSYRANGVLVNKIGVCQSYAMAYKYIMEKKLGITCGYASTSSHIWNLVKIGSQYYNVDVTWDDEGKSKVTTKYFLVSSNVMKSANKNQTISYQYTPSTTNYSAPTPAKPAVKLTDADRVAARSATTKIVAIGKVTLSRKAAITNARTAYNRLTAAQKTLVSGSVQRTLTNAETQYTKLRRAEDKKIAALKSAAKKAVPKSYQAKAQKKKVKLTWKKSGTISGYQVAYLKKGAKKWSYKTISAGKKTITITKLGSKSRYNFKIRSFRTINKQKVYSSWTKTKLVKVK